MSETNTTTEPELIPQPDPAPEPAPETQEGDPKPQRDANTEKMEKRLAQTTARLAAAERALAEATARMEAHGVRGVDPDAVELTPEQEAVVKARVERQVAQLDMQRAGERFHEAGKAAFADWADRCQNLVQMGADAAFSSLLVDMPDGARVAGALADDPEELERITGLRSERARAIALGKYAASLPEKPVARRVSQAPAPVRPVNGSTARAEVNPREMTAQQLVDHYTQEAMARRRGQQAAR